MFFSLISTIAQENNYFSPYLVGTYNLNMGNSMIQVVNPTARDLSIFIAFFDDNETVQKCFVEKLSPNDLVELDVNSILPRNSKPEFARLGVVKIISFIGDSLNPENVVPGIVGYQQNTGVFSCTRHASESNLSAIPQEILMKDLPIIMKKCNNH